MFLLFRYKACNFEQLVSKFSTSCRSTLERTNQEAVLLSLPPGKAGLSLTPPKWAVVTCPRPLPRLRPPGLQQQFDFCGSANGRASSQTFHSVGDSLQSDLFFVCCTCVRMSASGGRGLLTHVSAVFLMWLNGESMSVPLFLLHGIYSWTWESFERVLCHR